MPDPARTSVNDDEQDPVVLRVPVYIRPSTEQRPVCLFQYPLRPRWRPYNLDQSHSARVRPQQRHFEVTLGTECSPANFDGDSDSPMSSISLASTITSPKTSYAIGLLHADLQGVPEALCITPLDTTVQLRPSFAQIDAAEAPSGLASGAASAAGGSAASTPARRTKRVMFDVEDDDDDGDGSGAEDAGTLGADEDFGDDDDDAGGSTVAPQFRPAQTEREIEARRSSHAYLMEKREAEPWSNATMYERESEDSRAVREAVFGRPTPLV